MQAAASIGTSADLACGFPTGQIRPDPDARRQPRRQAVSMYWDHMNGWGWTMMVLWSAMWIGFLGVVAWVAVRWARGGSKSSGADAQLAKTARELLDERLAAGEIDIDEYSRRRSALEAPHQTGTPL